MIHDLWQPCTGYVQVVSSRRCFFVLAKNLQPGYREQTFAPQSGIYLNYLCVMEKEDKDTENDFDDKNGRPDEDLDFIQDFINRKKLQNKILREIIENMKQSDKE